MRSLVVLPTYNEALNVIALCRDVLAQDASLDVLVVDDASPDGTAELVEREAAAEPRLHLLRRPGKLGLGSAYQDGFRFALARDYERILTMDCDYSHHPSYLPGILRAADRGDVVIGSRYVPGGGVTHWPLARKLLSRFANLYTQVLLRLPVSDCTAGFRCYARRVLETVDPFAIRSQGYAFLEEMVWRVHRCGFRVVEIPIVFQDRRQGSSKISQSEIYRAAWHVLVLAIHPPTLPGA